MAYVAAPERQRRRYGNQDLLASYKNDPIGFITNGLGYCRESSWRSWRTILKAAYGQGDQLTEDELAFFREVSGGRNPPNRRVRELWLIVGRRGGKDSIASLMAVEAARFADCVALRPGERAIVACVATDRDQASIVFNYIRGYFEERPRLAAWLAESLPNSYRSGPIQLTNRTDIRVVTNNFRAPRGRAIAMAILDECAFYRDENSASPDEETYRAFVGGMGTVPDAMVVGISSPHKQSGLLFQKFEKHFGKDDDHVLVIKAPTRLMNPRIDEINPGLIDQAYEDDPELAAAEYGAEFRRDLVDYVSREVVAAAIDTGVAVRPPEFGVQYRAFVDPSGGAGGDSMTMAIAHEDAGRAIIDCLCEARPPFSPESVAKEFAEVALNYGVTQLYGDRFGGEWPREAFQKNGVMYEIEELTKSEIYQAFLPMLNSSRVRMLDHARCRNQLVRLERKARRGGRDTVDHPSGEHDDLINVVAGVALKAAGNERDSVVARYLAAA